MTAPMALLDDADRVRAALSPIRRRMLTELQAPGSAASLAAALDMPRQKVGYHLKALEDAGLVQLVEQRRKRGFTERLFTASADAYVVDPDLLAGPAPEALSQDRYAADHLIRAAAETVRDVGRMRQAADAEGRRLLTFTIDAEVAFAAPGDIERFAHRLTEAVAALVKDFDTPGGRPYRLIAATHPAKGSKARTTA
ncbi:MAG: ArsR family transcriptional regulator [Caulobacteraceae bacterium]|nr:helix-turn-helix domain-containing protein [Caulobacter sp.]RYF92587.1 MAG: ArsR family transcriptional regulator [Caulobacteraceae bacterium]